MKTLYLMALLSFGYLAKAQTKLSFHIDNFSNKSVSAGVAGEKSEITLDESGNGVLITKIRKGQYISLGTRKLYMEPGNDLEASFAGIGKGTKSAFKGKNAAENYYLNNGMASSDISEAFLAIVTGKKKIAQAREDFLNREVIKDLSAAFKEIEANRFDFRFYKNLREAGKSDPIIDDAAYMEIEEYPEYLRSYLALNVAPGDALDPAVTKARLKFITAKISAPVVKSYLFDFVLNSYISGKGIEGMEEPIKLYPVLVKDQQKIDAFNEECRKWKKLVKGAPVPEFAYQDTSGRALKLSALKGRYVYVDFWATWCGPCKAEIPALEEVQKQFSGKKIAFVSISIDKMEKVGAWKAMVAEKAMKGYQVHAGNDKTLCEFLKVNSIPRFVLLDKEGKIIDANMSRPSDPATEKVLTELPGI